MIVNFDDEVLIPEGDIGDFAVVACDQFSSAPEYWNKLAAEMPHFSALDFILPECFLSQSETRIADIKRTYAEMPENRFKSYRGAVYVTRTTSHGRIRHGVVASVNLSDYDFKPGNSALIRASERTIESRIPPRVKIRESIDIEIPHIMLLVDDRDGVLMRACRNADKHTVYDGELKACGGHIKGELITDTAELYKAVDDIISASVEKYGQKLFALVGDGNHSLATAKYCSEFHKTEYNVKALVEIVDIYDDGLVFEPIHRLIKTDDPAMFADSLRSAVKGDDKVTVYTPQPITLSVPSDKVKAINAIDNFCETYVKHFGGYIEYVHSIDDLKRDGYFGIEMRNIQKSELFEYVIKNGVLPKKAFSLGEADEKRYYVEARKIK